MSIFTVTERGTFRRCRRRWDYTSLNRQGLTPVSGATNLTLGLVIHKALELWIEEHLAGGPVSELETLYLLAASDELDSIKNRYRLTVGADPSDVELADTYEAIILGQSMMKNYQAQWGSPIPESFNLIKAEQQIVVKVPGTRHRLEAKIDCLLEGKKTGMLYALDHKTYRARPHASSIQQNDQFLAYQWVLSQAYPGRVGGFLYDGLWKRATPPRNGSLSDLFMRQVSVRLPHEFEEFGKIVGMELREMGSPKTPIYPNRQWQGCWDCGMEKLCTAQSRGESYELVKNANYTHREADYDLVALRED